ncbi:MAG: hypothetical protein VKP72_12020 [bacterium]|nr:hypothetical protein [bacterium]
MSKIAKELARKRQQAERYRSLARKVRLRQAAPLAGGVLGFILAGGTGQLGLMGAGAAVGAVAPLLLQRQIEDLELRIRQQLLDRAQAVDAQTTEAGAGVEHWFGEFTLRYLGGHPGLRVAKEAAFGKLSCTDRGVVFQNRDTRIRMAPARIQRISLESPRQVNARKLPGVLPVPVMTHAQPLVAKLFSALVRRQRVVLVDYLDDLGERNWIVFHETWMLPGHAARVRSALEAAIRSVPKDRRVQAGARGTGSLAQAAAATRNDLEAAERASQVLLVEGSHVDGMARGQQRPPLGRRCDVVLEGMGTTAQEFDRVVEELARIFGKPPDRFRELQARLPMVIRRNLPADEAQRLADLLGRAGATVRFDPTSAAT